ncbi:MAG: choice-of-anchor B family protein [Ilumatobacteraceae bacterium]
MQTPAASIRRVTGAAMALSLLLVVMTAPTGAAAHPGLHPKDEHAGGGLGMEVLAPDALAGFFTAVQWGDTGEVADQQAELVYGGTGCSPASYAAADVSGRIALIDSRVSETNPADQCPASTFVQKVRSAQLAGAIGLVQIPAEGEEPRANATAVAADIPALEVERTDAVLAVRDAVIAADTPVEALLTNTHEPIELVPMSDEPCVDGQAGPFPCDGIDLLSFVPQEEFNGAGVSDLWGWSDPEGGEYVIVGKTNGVAFFDITEPTAPVYLGELPNPGLVEEIWHDIKVYANHAFIVSESSPHGMTVFDLTRLRDVDTPQQWDSDATYPLNVSAHNLEINTDTGFAYIVGGSAALVVPDQCLSGLHMVDINDPTNPTFAGCYFEEGGPGTAARTAGEPVTDVSPAAYVHDAQCVVYDGPDTRYTGREICFNSAEDKVVIVDVTDKLNPVTLGMTAYDNVGYTHQGWLTEDHGYLLVNDELDETTYDQPSRTVVLDVTDLENPKPHFDHFHDTRAITHNNYVVDGRVYQSNYTSGLRVLDTASVADPDQPRLEPLAFFDTFPMHEEPTFEGTWSNYPFFESGTIAVSGIDEGLFLLRLAEDGDDTVTRAVEIACTDCPVEVRAGEVATAHLRLTNLGDVDDTYEITLDGVPDGWNVTAPTPVAVAAGETGELGLDIEVPRRAKAGSYAVTVTATSATDPAVSAATPVEVEVRKGKPSQPGRSESNDTEGAGAEAPAVGPAGTTVASATAAGAVGEPGRQVGPLTILAVIAAVALLGPLLAAIRRRIIG